MGSSEIKSELKRRLLAEGFDAVGFTTPDAVKAAGGRLERFLANGWHGDMAWMETHAARRAHPNALWPEARSIIMAGMNYGPESDPLEGLARRDRASISVYARGRDYHDILKGKLKQAAGWLHGASGAEVKVFVDTAPVLEKPLAHAAGIGWQGKHTNLVSRDLGSWLFLGSIFTAADLPPDEAEEDHCGSCRKCLDICPTDAFPAPYQLDARRCISYLTIEHKGAIPARYRAAMGNRIYGCDDCLAVCPWNKFAETAREAKLKTRHELDAVPLERLAALDDAAFREMFSGSPIKRTGRDRFLRNVMIAIGNSEDPSLLPVLEARLDDDAALVRAMAVWAYGRLAHPSAFARAKAARLCGEADQGVRREWERDVTPDVELDRADT